MILSSYSTQDIVSAVATFSTIAFFFTGIDICLKIKRKGSTNGLSMFPFVACTVCSVLWLRYGLLKTDMTLIYVNAAGAFIEFLYVLYFYSHADEKKPLHRMLLGATCILFATLVYIKYLAEDVETAKYHLGLLCTFGAVINFGAPLASIAEVLRTKSTECLALPLCLANFVVALEWFIYGVIIHDSFVKIPNVLGSMLGVAQLSLFVVYPRTENPPRYDMSSPTLKAP